MAPCNNHQHNHKSKHPGPLFDLQHWQMSVAPEKFFLHLPHLFSSTGGPAILEATINEVRETQFVCSIDEYVLMIVSEEAWRQ